MVAKNTNWGWEGRGGEGKAGLKYSTVTFSGGYGPEVPSRGFFPNTHAVIGDGLGFGGQRGGGTPRELHPASSSSAPNAELTQKTFLTNL